MAEMVRKAKTGEIVNHWVLAVSCILLIITGYAFLFQLKQIGALFGGFNAMKAVHNWAGVVFSLSLLATTYSYLSESLHLGPDDREWLRKGGGYLTRDKPVKIPPMGKLNTGQKLYYLAVLLGGIAIAVSGFVIWFWPDGRVIRIVSHLAHNLAFSLFIVAVPVHAYLGSLANPGTFRIMVYGTVPLEFARKKYPKWIEEMKRK
ncbi:MAG: cytochrome b/b6 domain-containing protein [Nitrospirota bacterium]